MQKKAKSPTQLKLDSASQQGLKSFAWPRSLRKRAGCNDAEDSTSGTPVNQREDATSASGDSEEMDDTSYLSHSPTISDSTPSREVDTSDQLCGEPALAPMAASKSAEEVRDDTIANASTADTVTIDDSLTHVSPNQTAHEEGEDVVAALLHEGSQVDKTWQLDGEKATSIQTTMLEVSELTKLPGGATAIAQESLDRVDEGWEGEETAHTSLGQHEDDWQPSPLDGETQIEEPEWPVPQPEDTTMRASSAEQHPIEDEDRDTSGPGDKMKNCPPLHIDTTTFAEDGQRERTPDLVTSVGSEAMAHGVSHSPPSSVSRFLNLCKHWPRGAEISF